VSLALASRFHGQIDYSLAKAVDKPPILSYNEAVLR
jgi:hypothetical protein